jgi:hypothetical protein
MFPVDVSLTYYRAPLYRRAIYDARQKEPERTDSSDGR